MKKFLFLDFDGVITTLRSGWRLDPDKLVLLGEILDSTNASIIISSSWRLTSLETTLARLKDTTFYFNNNIAFPYCDKIIGVTERLERCKCFDLRRRGYEIKLWLTNNVIDEDYTYCILDDDPDMLKEQLPYFINTDWETGLSEDNVRQAINILNRII